MFAPEMPPVDLPEFFGKMSEFRKVVSEVDIGALPQEKAELFRGLLKEFDSSAATLKAELPGILDDLRSEYKEAVASAENEHASNMAAIEKARQRLADAPARQAERARALAEASAKVKEEREKADMAAAAEMLAGKPKTLPFSPGGELTKELLSLGGAPPSTKGRPAKPIGNIWDDWDPNHKPDLEAIEKLLRDSDIIMVDPNWLEKLRSRPMQ